MQNDVAKPADTVTATIDLTIAGRRGRLDIPVPSARVRAVDLLPLLQSLTDTLVNIAVENAESAGERVSCRKGCGACCRQLVPIAEVEVQWIRHVVQELPETQRNAVIDRFAEARLRLGQAGLLERLGAPGKLSDDDLQPLGIAYFAQGIPCPFLEDESCSIHADRPLSCREYLVTSPAENCTTPTPSTIRCVAVPAKVSNAVWHLETDGEPVPNAWVPLSLALDWPLAEKSASSMIEGTSRMANLLANLFGRDIPPPKTAKTSPDQSGIKPPASPGARGGQ